MAHQGKILKRAIERADLTQEDAAHKMGFSTRHGLIRLFDRESLSEKHVEKAIEAFGLKRETFFPQPITTEPAPDKGPSCWQLLAESRQQIIDLQQQIINMTMPNINAPKVKETV